MDCSRTCGQRSSTRKVSQLVSSMSAANVPEVVERVALPHGSAFYGALGLDCTAAAEEKVSDPCTRRTSQPN